MRAGALAEGLYRKEDSRQECGAKATTVQRIFAVCNKQNGGYNENLISIWMMLRLNLSLAACQRKIGSDGSVSATEKVDINDYDTEGVVEIIYSEIDPVCEEEELRAECEKILLPMQESDDILLSFVVDRSVLIEKDEFGKYDHLVMVNPTLD